MLEVYVTTQNGICKLIPLFCEITGTQICWQTHTTEFKPAYISFEVVSETGKYNAVELQKINTF